MEILRIYKLINKIITKSDKVFDSYDDEISSGFMLVIIKILGFISEHEKERNELFEALINREDIIKYLFCHNMVVEFRGSEECKLESLLDIIIYKEEDSEIQGYFKTGIHLNKVFNVDMNEKELKEIYDKYSDILFNKEKEYYYSNCTIFVDYISENEKIEFIDRLVRNDRITRIKRVLEYNKFEEFLNKSVESKNKLEAVILIEKISK